MREDRNIVLEIVEIKCQYNNNKMPFALSTFYSKIISYNVFLIKLILIYK